MKNSTIILCCLIILQLPEAKSAETELKDLPPVVIRTYPASGHDSVDPEISQIYATFNKKMNNKSWSFVKVSKNSFPDLAGEPSFDELQQTCTLNVKLQPDTTYIIWLNKDKSNNFKDTEGRSAVPYLLAFKTAGGNFITKKKNAIASALNWLDLLESEKFADSWKNTAPLFQTKVPEATWINQISAIKKSLGKNSNRELKSISFAKQLPGAPDGEYFIIRFQSSFANKPKIIETITPKLNKNGDWQVSGYYLK